MRESSRRDIRIKAHRFREKCKVSQYGIIDLFRECEQSGYKMIRYPLGENADLGFTLKKDSDIIIFTNTCSRLSREIFTLAHEIGHAVLHMETAASFIDDHITISGRSSDIKEQEANYFAACLLLPADSLKSFLDLELPEFYDKGLSAIDIARIMSEFNVSFDMTLNRLENLGFIDANAKILLDNEKTEKRVGNLLRSVGGNSRLNFASKEIYVPYEYLEYIIYNYNRGAIPKETLKKALECYQLNIEDISDKLVEQQEDEDDLDELIGGLDD